MYRKQILWHTIIKFPYGYKQLLQLSLKEVQFDINHHRYEFVQITVPDTYTGVRVSPCWFKLMDFPKTFQRLVKVLRAVSKPCQDPLPSWAHTPGHTQPRAGVLAQLYTFSINLRIKLTKFSTQN